jgi:hypothetical protein
MERDVPSTREFVCRPCRKSFTRNENLTAHLESAHSGERRYHCDKPGCQHSFMTRRELNGHRRIHGDRQYICKRINRDGTLCGKSPTRKQDLLRHCKTCKARPQEEVEFVLPTHIMDVDMIDLDNYHHNPSTMHLIPADHEQATFGTFQAMDNSMAFGWEQQRLLVPTQAHDQHDSSQRQNRRTAQRAFTDPVSNFLLDQNLSYRAQTCFLGAMGSLAQQMCDLAYCFHALSSSGGLRRERRRLEMLFLTTPLELPLLQNQYGDLITASRMLMAQDISSGWICSCFLALAAGLCGEPKDVDTHQKVCSGFAVIWKIFSKHERRRLERMLPAAFEVYNSMLWLFY